MASTFVVRGECKICLEDRIEVESFRVLPCGHCFCQNCIRDLFARDERRKIPCPFCRKKCLRTDPNPLVFHPVVVDPTRDSVDQIVDGLNRMDKSCKTVSVKRAHVKMAKAAENIEEDNAERLRKAIEDFSQRIIPLFEELELGRKRIQELEEDRHAQFRDLTTKARRVDSLQKEVIGLRKSKEELESNYMEALDSADALRIKVEELQSSLTGVRENLITKEEEYRRVMDSLNRFKSSDTLKTRKLKAVKQQVDELRTKLADKENRMDDENFPMVVDQGWTTEMATPGPAEQPSSLPAVFRHTTEEGWVAADNFRFEGMPGPGFKPSWSAINTSGKKANVLLKSKPQPGGKNANSKSPLTLDAKGRPTIAVQTGPKSLIRTVQRY